MTKSELLQALEAFTGGIRIYLHTPYGEIPIRSARYEIRDGVGRMVLHVAAEHPARQKK